MPAEDRYHYTVKRALIKDGWRITREQVRISFEDKKLWVDMQAERADAQQIILIEVKELDDVSSPIEALANALGKYLLYRMGLRNAESSIPLYMAITEAAYNGIMQSSIGQQAIQEFNLFLLIFDPNQEKVTRWIH
ncbi:MAG: fatty-acid synthase [Anaerolineae bacterium]|nr:fatty-acid synthase [Anaerolineae bacterium]